MKVLILNAFAETEYGKRMFFNFEKVVKSAFRQCKPICGTTPEFIIRNKKNIDDYLVEKSMNTSGNDPMRNIQQIDMVFMDGDVNIPPWSKCLGKLRMFFKTCKKMDIPIYAGGCGLSLLIYYCATFLKEINVINGKEKGTVLEKIHSIDEEVLKQLSHQDVFLDNATGDFFVFQQELRKWIPLGNTGLHHVKTAELHGSFGAYFKKVKTYRIKSLNEREHVYTAKVDELKCYVVKQYLHHWALQNIKNEFVISNKNYWDPHKVNITNINEIGENYKTLIETDRGPQIIEHKNTLATQNHINTKYSESFTVLVNFVQHHIPIVQSEVQLTPYVGFCDFSQIDKNTTLYKSCDGRVPSPFAPSVNSKNSLTPTRFFLSPNTKATKITVSNCGNRPVSAIGRKNIFTRRSSSTTKYTKEFKHCGHNYIKKRNIIVVDNNAMHEPIPATSILSNPKFLKSPSTNSINLSEFSQSLAQTKLFEKSVEKKNKWNTLASEWQKLALIIKNQEIEHSQQKTLNSSQLLISTPNQEKPHEESILYPERMLGDNNVHNKSMLSLNSPSIYMKGMNKSKSVAQYEKNTPIKSPLIPQQGGSQKKNSQNNSYLGTLIQSVANYNPKNNSSRKDMAEIEYKNNLIKDMNASRGSSRQIRKQLHPELGDEYLPSDRIYIPGMKSVNDLLANPTKKRTRIRVKSNTPFCRYKQFMNLPKNSFEIPCIRISGPFINAEKERRKDSKDKWISKENFWAYFEKASKNNNSSFIPNYVSRDPSPAPCNHKFRDKDKKKWIAGHFKA